jgi:hypothetical protein
VHDERDEILLVVQVDEVIQVLDTEDLKICFEVLDEETLNHLVLILKIYSDEEDECDDLLEELKLDKNQKNQKTLILKRLMRYQFLI